MPNYDNMIANPDWGSMLKPVPPQNWNRDDYDAMVFEDEYVFELFFKNRPSVIVGEKNLTRALLYDNDVEDWLKDQTVVMSGEEFLEKRREELE